MTDQLSATAVSYRRITDNDAEAAHRLSLSVRWPHRLDDWRFMLRLGAGFVAEDGDGIVGTAMCWSHGTEFASLGMVIVDAARQGQGIGRKLMSMVMNELGNRNVLLHATEAGKPLYEKMGFKQTGEIHQHQGTVFKSPPAPCCAACRRRARPARPGGRRRAIPGDVYARPAAAASAAT